MKNIFSILLATTLTLTGCSSLGFYGAATGSGLGGMFGSAIGGLMGGPRGADAGTVIGMVAGGVAGAAVTSRNEEHTSSSYERNSYHDEVDYDYTPQRHYSNSVYDNIFVRNVTFNDENGNRSLDSRERAYIILDIYNNGRTDVYEIAPTITCDNRHVVISPTAIISSLGSGRGARYKAAVTTRGKLKNGAVRFNVSFNGGRTTAKTFTIQTRR